MCSFVDVPIADRRLRGSKQEEQVLRLESLIAYLLQKNEQLGLTVEGQSGKDNCQTA